MMADQAATLKEDLPRWLRPLDLSDLKKGKISEAE